MEENFNKEKLEAVVLPEGETGVKRKWIEKYSHSTYADWWLSFFSFIEASFFPLPPSTLMIAIMSSKERHKSWLYYATITTITSVLGGLFGYLIGSVFYETLGEFIIRTYDLADEIEKVRLLFEDNAFLAIFVAAFTPIPYKVFTIAAGFFNINLLIFIVASLLGRGLRFYIVAFVVKFLGDRAPRKYMDWLNRLALFVAILVIIYFFYKIFQAFF